MINVDDGEIFSKCYLVLMKNISTCCMEDCPACIAANAPVRPEGLPGGLLMVSESPRLHRKNSIRSLSRNDLY